jgi:hypothetical protein
MTFRAGFARSFFLETRGVDCFAAVALCGSRLGTKPGTPTRSGSDELSVGTPCQESIRAPPVATSAAAATTAAAPTQRRRGQSCRRVRCGVAAGGSVRPGRQKPSSFAQNPTPPYRLAAT